MAAPTLTYQVATEGDGRAHLPGSFFTGVREDAPSQGQAMALPAFLGWPLASKRPLASKTPSLPPSTLSGQLPAHPGNTVQVAGAPRVRTDHRADCSGAAVASGAGGGEGGGEGGVGWHVFELIIMLTAPLLLLHHQVEGGRTRGGDLGGLSVMLAVALAAVLSCPPPSYAHPSAPKSTAITHLSRLCCYAPPRITRCCCCRV